MTQQLTQKQREYHPWVIYRETSMGWRPVTRFRSRPDAEDYLKVLRRNSPAITYELAFEQPVTRPVTTSFV